MAFGAYVCYGGAKLPYVAEVGPGPGFFPLWIGIGLLIFSACLACAAFAGARKPAANDALSGAKASRAMAGWLALMVAIALFAWVGFGVSFVLLTVFLVVVLDRRPPLLALGVGIILAVAFHLIFVVALNVSLPAASWGF